LVSGSSAETSLPTYETVDCHTAYQLVRYIVRQNTKGRTVVVLLYGNRRSRRWLKTFRQKNHYPSSEHSELRVSCGRERLQKLGGRGYGVEEGGLVYRRGKGGGRSRSRDGVKVTGDLDLGKGKGGGRSRSREGKRWRAI
jgi:hypothetical protein